MKKLRFTEEFLWQLCKLLETASNINNMLAHRSWQEIVSPEWRELRLNYEKRKRTKSFSQSLSYLRSRGYIKISVGKGAGSISLTPEGKRIALEGQKKMRVLSPRKDGKMIMLMYDIPKRKQYVRQVFRSALELLGYQMLQKSVWVSSKDVLRETEQIIREYALDGCVSLFVIEKIVVQ